MTNREKNDVRQFDRRQALGLMGAAGLGMASAWGEQVAGAQAAPPPNPNAPVAPWEPSTSAPAIPTWRTELKQLAPNVWTYIQAGGPNIPTGGISNALAVAGPDHWLAVDALGQPFHTKAFIAAANKATGKPCGRLVNTHHHGDHVAGSAASSVATLFTSRSCRTSTAATRSSRWQRPSRRVRNSRSARGVPMGRKIARSRYPSRPSATG